MWKQPIRWWKIIKQYLSNCNIHGVRYLVDDRLSYPERFFWLLSCALCWYGCAKMIRDVLRNYINYPVAVTTETLFVDWETPFPAIAFCISTTRAIKTKYFKRNPGMFTNYTNPLLLQATAEELLSAYEEVHVLNNLQLPMLTNVEMDEIHIKGGKTTHIGFTMDDTFNEDGVKTVAVRHRSCRFPHETLPNNMFNIYSSDSCYIELIIERMIKFCGCVNFYYFVPNEARVCNGTEMVCIIANKANITSQSVKDERCLPDCEGTAIVLNRMEPYEYDSPGSSYSRLQFALLSHPTMRYRRYVVNDLLDVVVIILSFSWKCSRPLYGCQYFKHLRDTVLVIYSPGQDNIEQMLQAWVLKLMIDLLPRACFALFHDAPTIIPSKMKEGKVLLIKAMFDPSFAFGRCTIFPLLLYLECVCC
ncbi:pickpocket 13 isoform X4 [Andrena cerasifolii]|uniref:pickpocket 13 isoform X4 n=1 Tax=Andrena cerasifolii TaxID=2819439 RepID=UPI0040382CBC